MRYQKYSHITTGQLKNDYENGESTVTLSKKYGIEESSIRKRFDRIGFKMRTKRESILNSYTQGRRNWKSGRISTDGYVLVLKHGHPRANRDGYVREHILIWESTHHRSLPLKLVVHHLNGIKDDNRPENLFAIDQSSHHKLMGPYKKRIRELEQEITKLKQKTLGFSDQDLRSLVSHV